MTQDKTMDWQWKELSEAHALLLLCPVCGFPSPLSGLQVVKLRQGSNDSLLMWTSWQSVFIEKLSSWAYEEILTWGMF